MPAEVWEIKSRAPPIGFAMNPITPLAEPLKNPFTPSSCVPLIGWEMMPYLSLVEKKILVEKKFSLKKNFNW